MLNLHELSLPNHHAHAPHIKTHTPADAHAAKPSACAGDLGAIAKEYDTAVSSSCPALDYIVVETTSAAQRCVELLRQRQLGVATFLILEKQQHLAGAMREKKQPPEGGAPCVGRRHHGLNVFGWAACPCQFGISCLLAVPWDSDSPLPGLACNHT